MALRRAAIIRSVAGNDEMQRRVVGADRLHSYLSGDAAPMTPGRAEQLRITLWPIAVAVRKGDRLRLAIAGADADNLERVPAAGPETLVVRRTHEAPSFVDIPTLPRQPQKVDDLH